MPGFEHCELLQVFVGVVGELQIVRVDPAPALYRVYALQVDAATLECATDQLDRPDRTLLARPANHIGAKREAVVVWGLTHSRHQDRPAATTCCQRHPVVTEGNRPCRTLPYRTIVGKTQWRLAGQTVTGEVGGVHRLRHGLRAHERSAKNHAGKQ